MKAKDEALILALGASAIVTYLLLSINDCFSRNFTEQRTITITVTILVLDVGFFFCVHLIQQLHSKLRNLFSVVLQELGVFSGFFSQLLKLLAYLVIVDLFHQIRNNSRNFHCYLFIIVYYIVFCLFFGLFVCLVYFCESDLMLIASGFAAYFMVRPTSVLSILLIIIFTKIVNNT